MRECAGVTTLCMMMTILLGASAVAQDDVVERRQQVLEAAERGVEALPVLERALEDDNSMVHRAAIRGLVAIGAPAHTILERAFDTHDDPVVRRAALLALAGEPTLEAVPYLTRAMADDDAYVRAIAVRLLLGIEPPTDETLELLRLAEGDEAPSVHRPAGRGLAALDPDMTPFEIDPVETVPLRERPEMADRAHQIVAAWEMRLPREGWRFRADTRLQGHRENWFEEDFDDSGWEEAAIETAWMTGYIGVGWYRREIEIPAEPEHLAAELLFEGVDESAWVWVNGEYVGGQDIGPSGWNRPFRVDVTDQLRWGDTNQITVRAMNTAAAGGIWRPITLEALALR